MRNKRSGISWVLVVIIAIVVIAIIVIGSVSFRPPSDLPIKVSYSLDHSTIEENESAKLTVSVKNQDGNSHEVEFFFNTSSRIKIYAGNETLLEKNTFNFEMGDYERDQDREFTVVGSLEENVVNSKYRIRLEVQVDGETLPELSKNIYLTIKKP